MKFNFFNNHILVTVDTDRGPKTCIFDTGSPATFFFDPVDEYTLDGATHRVRPNPMVQMLSGSRASLNTLVGRPIDGIIGTESFKTSTVTIDFPNAQLNIPQNPLAETIGIAMNSMFGLPIFDITINNQTIRTAYDTGAMYTFVLSSLATRTTLTPQGITYDDYNPMLGDFTADLYTGDLRIGATPLGIHNIALAPAYDRCLQLLNTQAILGNDTLRHATITLSYPTNRLLITTTEQ